MSLFPISSQTRRNVALPAILASLALTLQPVATAAGFVGPDVAVRYSEDAVATSQDAAQLLNRLESAAATICAPLGHGDIASRRNQDNCVARLTAAAVAKVNRPLLTAAYKDARKLPPSIATVSVPPAIRQAR